MKIIPIYEWTMIEVHKDGDETVKNSKPKEAEIPPAIKTNGEPFN
jgi:hypothetical protein